MYVEKHTQIGSLSKIDLAYASVLFNNITVFTRTLQYYGMVVYVRVCVCLRPSVIQTPSDCL